MAVLPGEKTTITIGSAVAQVISISGPSEERPTVDTTNLDSTAREFRFGLKDGGECTVEVYYDSSYHSSLHDKINDSTSSAVTIDLFTADGTSNESISFNAYLTGWEMSGMEVEGNVTATMTLKVDGDVTY